MWYSVTFCNKALLLDMSLIQAWRENTSTPSHSYLILLNSLSLLFSQDSFLRKKSTCGNTLLNGPAQYFSCVASWKGYARNCTIDPSEDCTVEDLLPCTRLYVLPWDLSFCLSWKQLFELRKRNPYISSSVVSQNSHWATSSATGVRFPACRDSSVTWPSSGL